MMDMLIYDAINRGTLTALSSGVTMVLVSPSRLSFPVADARFPVFGASGHVLVFPRACPKQQTSVLCSLFSHIAG
jgi:hypothetical protein